jgi:hypothetical protein
MTSCPDLSDRPVMATAPFRKRRAAGIRLLSIKSFESWAVGRSSGCTHCIGSIHRYSDTRAGGRVARAPGPSVSTIAGTLPFGLIVRNEGACWYPLLVSSGMAS